MINDPEIQRLLSGFDLDSIHCAEETMYVMRPDLTLAYVNLGWKRFADRNGGDPSIFLNWPIGCSVQDAIPEILRPFFAENFAKCLRERRPWQHQYECSSPEFYRSFVMMNYPLGEGEGILVVNSLVQETSHTRIASEPLEAVYRNEDGIIKQCCHCRRVQRCGPVPAWDWVPEWVRTSPTNTSHGLCGPCFGFYYPEQRLYMNGFPETFQTRE